MIDAGSWDDSRSGDRHFTFWETPDGTPVSMAAATSAIGGMVRIDPVYTPAHLRGRGYAGAVTVEASRAALAAGATDVVLFTDRTTPPATPSTSALGMSTSPTSPGTRSPEVHHTPGEGMIGANAPVTYWL